MQDAKKISIIVPAFNEEDSIGTVLERLVNLKERLLLEIVVVDDGSTDRTSEVVSKFPDIKKIRLRKNAGKGKALATGIFHCVGDIIVIQDADLEYAPEEIPRLVKSIVAGEADVVFGSRFLGLNKGMSAAHTIGNKIISLVSSITCGVRITDVMTGHKAFLRELTKDMQFNSRGFPIETELTVKLLALNGGRKVRFREVPITYKARWLGRKKIRKIDGIQSILTLFSERLKTPLKR